MLASKVREGSITILISRQRHHEERSKRSWPGPAATIHASYGVTIAFSRTVGRGTAYFDLEIRPDSFAALAKAMIQGAPDEAIRAFGKALATVKPTTKP
ncbi:hypothetical protein CIT25_18500 [Mesorhizobium mediterraneum]|uniref:Uncharacterized protein n=1 Tax=Mesorhizobium mediterraneum TaxID=43617 RepID=A0AB36R8V0_9HYPH|nr:hypothetical protein CIT25_18500 [Mesorhizobium mediterraneum]